MTKILKSVGRGGANLYSDVLAIQGLLNKYSIPGATVPLKADGKAGPQTITRIELFQEKVMKMVKPDGRVDPDGKTLLKLTAEAKANNNFSLSSNALDLLKFIEKLRLKPYDDQTGKDITSWCKGATIGYGHLIPSHEWEKYKNGIDAAAAQNLFVSDVFPYVMAVTSKVTAQLSQNQFDALVIFVFNIGINGFSSSAVLKLVNDPTATTVHKDLESAWKAWNKSQGIVNAGLVNRRNAEWNIYSNNLYQRW